jgi:hypothetical protein
MATKLQKAIRFTLLWMLVPAGLAAIGYYVIGPQLGSHEAPQAEPREEIQDEEEDGPSEPKTVRNYVPPAIEVEVKRGQTIRERDMVIRQPRPKPKPKPEEAPPAPTAPTSPVISPPSDGQETVPVGDGEPNR